MFSIPWYEKPLLLFALFYPALGIVMARRRLASGRGSVVTLATLPLATGAVAFWLGLPAAAEGAIRLSSFSNTDISGISGAATLLFVTCLSTLLVLAGILPYRVAEGDERPGSTRLTSIVNGAPFVLAVTGMVYGFMLRWSSALPTSLLGMVLGLAVIGLHLVAIGRSTRPESRATAKAVFVSTIILALAIWQYRSLFQVAID